MAARSVRVEIRFDLAERLALRASAAGAGVSASEFVRRRVNGALAAGLPGLGTEPKYADTGGVGWRGPFLEALALSPTVTAACRVAGISRTLAYREKKCSREFGVAWELAREEAEYLLAERLHGSPLTPRLVPPPSPLADRSARPRRGTAARGRRARLQLRLAPAELETWRAAATAARLDLSGLVRRLVRGPVTNPAGHEGGPCSWRSPFLDGLRRTGSVTEACAAAGVSRALAYKEQHQSPAFALAWETAAGTAEDRLLELLFLWGVTGVSIRTETVVWDPDRLVETRTVRERRRYSFWALRELLRRTWPQTYGTVRR